MCQIATIKEAATLIKFNKDNFQLHTVVMAGTTKATIYFDEPITFMKIRKVLKKWVRKTKNHGSYWLKITGINEHHTLHKIQLVDKSGEPL
jgi:hypothetical protein